MSRHDVPVSKDPKCVVCGSLIHYLDLTVFLRGDHAHQACYGGSTGAVERPSENEGQPREANGRPLLAAYEEICRAYHAIDDFRMKLLGLLPFASLVGVLLIGKTDLLAGLRQGEGNELLGFAAIFAAMLTLALFGYEVMGIQRCHSLITEGKHLEERLGIEHGLFHVCEKEHVQSPIRALNAKLIACVIYSLVWAGWLFIALRFGFSIETHTCVLWAATTGVVVAGLNYSLVRKLTPP